MRPRDGMLQPESRSLRNPVMTDSLLRGFLRRTPALGERERHVLDVLWTAGECSAPQVQGLLDESPPLSLSTVQSTLERLTRKGLLRRVKDGRMYRYQAAVSRGELTAHLVAELVDSLARPTAGAAGFVDPSQPVDEHTLDELEAWVQAQRARQEAGE